MTEQPNAIIQILIDAIEEERDAFRELADVWRVAYFDQAAETERLRQTLKQYESLDTRERRERE